MKLTSKGRYTLCAVMDLANNDKGHPVRLKEISDRQSISLHYLEQLFRKLRTGGIVKSVRGPGGGYILAKATTELTVIQILQAVGESVTYHDQISISETSTAEAKKTAEYFGHRIDHEVLKLLQTDTLASLLG